MKAMILAAGLGKRMQPLTLTTPKPLLKVGNTTLIDHALQQLQLAGIKEVMINVHHLGDQIITHCGDGSAYNLKIHYSVEDILLETGGGIFQALSFFNNEPFLVMSADVWTDFSLKKLLTIKTKAAHLIFVDNPEYHPAGDYGLDEHGIVQLHSDKKFTYANIAVIHPSLFDGEKHGVFKLSSVFKKAIEKKNVTGEYYSGEWFNVGTTDDLIAIQTHASKIDSHLV